EELQAEARSEVVTLRLARRALENHLWTEGPIHGAWCPGAGVNRTGNEFPKRFEALEHGIVRIEIVCRGVVKVGGDPNRVADGGMIQEGQQVGDLNAAAKRHAGVGRATGNRPEGRVGCDDFPCCGGTLEFALEPGKLNRAEKISVRSVLRRWLRVGAAIAAHIEQ